MEKISIFGLGYVGLSLATLLSKENYVSAIDIDEKKVELINNKISPIGDLEIQKKLKNTNKNLKCYSSIPSHIYKSDFVIIATPTDFDHSLNAFNLNSVISVLESLSKISCKSIIVIKSTVPVGFTQKVSEEYTNLNILFSPEFLREGMSIQDNINPTRIIAGGKKSYAQRFINLLLSISSTKDVKCLIMSTSEAEAVKLFSNTYLAMRVAFFNELDTFSIQKKLDTKMIIQGISSDPRIGDGYNNPSFGYGGYCLPKDTRQLLSNFEDIPQDLISSIINANSKRKEFISDKINEQSPKYLGVYRLTMKTNSDNFRVSAILDILEKINKEKTSIIIYEPLIKEDSINGYKIQNCLNDFKQKSSIIIANRYHEELKDVLPIVFSRDIFNEN